MTPKTPEENEEQKLIQWAQSHPGFIAKLLGRLKLGKKEKPSPHKTNACRSNLEKAREALKVKRDLERVAPKTESSE